MGGGGGKDGGGGGASSKIDITNSGTTTVDVVGLDNVDVRTELVLPQPLKAEQVLDLRLPQPLRTEGRNEFAITQPVVTDNRNRMELDVKPVVMDLCLKLDIGKVPPTRIRQPYNLHFGFTWLGLELLGFNFYGESQTIVEANDPGPKVVGGGYEQLSPRPRHAKAESGGLRIRLGE